MIEVRCKSCNGSGKLMGGGMLIHDCVHCEGVGKVYKLPPEEKKQKKEKNKEQLNG